MTKTYNDMIGVTYGRLTPESIYRLEKTAYAKCVCACGKFHDVRVRYLQEGSVQSCGCLQIELAKSANTKYEYNKQFFLSNAPEMFYVLGLFYTDGNLSPNRCRFRLGFKAEDKYMLEQIGLMLKGSDKLEYNKAGNAYELSGADETIYNQLIAHGVTPRKSKTMVIAEHLLTNAHFWRGMIDGNGWISTTGKNIVVGLCGTVSVCESFKAFCRQLTGGFPLSILERSENFGQMTIYGKRTLAVLEVLYKDKGEMYLKRKFNKYQDCLKGETNDLVL